ncbi:valine--tRNA ligase [Candidatus Nanohalococcus occultus]|uniref:Valine--tRNA ligase n=1 Tax=Candidatus Nanohalococcus occultus TaxID=2978047 RepID=A0ABY8CEM2_9ARCH|nr:Valyl-tRNA synthetase [Candidatus Nanohaloarchaeota archaeon SVXNc]
MPEGDYDAEKVEAKWQRKWVKEETFKYPGAENEREVFSIDTPPPTVSGSLHMGHLYGQTLQDFQARFQRMRGKKVFQPFGYDDNGIASERLTEKELGIRHQDFTRREFQEKCRKVCKEYEDQFTENMQSLGVSHDWTNTYKTIEPRVQKISQLSFIDLYDKGREYRKKAPAIWCPDCETAISQVETEDMEQQAHFNDIEFPMASGNGSIVISTTRPELLPACVAIMVHPEDEANAHLAGEKVKVPIFDYEVPIIEDEDVDIETGTGVVMVCTFGDQKDIEWYQAHDLPLRTAIDESGTMTDLAGKYEGIDSSVMKKKIVEDLDEEGYLLDRERITHDVQVHERCDTGIEFMVTEQWYVEILDNKEKYLDAGDQMEWFPEKMKTRYTNWIEGLKWDWCISRQRDSGIPFPVWYCKDCGQEVLAAKKDLPVDPLEDEPPFEECPDCGCEEFEAEEDVFDTWATSSLTPLVNAGWDWNEETEEYEMSRPELYSFDVRPEGHDIISFWLFHTVVKCYEHTGEVPFDSVMNHGHVLDENREKMSTSRGNVVAPKEVLEEFPVDAARYWAAGSKVGDDFPFKEKELVSGEKLMRKIWNASKLVEQLSDEDIEVEESDLSEMDKFMLAKTDELLEEVTEHFESYEFAKARDKIRSSFWDTFCGDYLEVSKQKLDTGDYRGTQHTLRRVHERYLKMFAPIISHVTEQVYSEMYDGESIHLSRWPEKTGIKADVQRGENAFKAISALRKYKTSNQMSPTAELGKVELYSNVEGFEEEIKGTMHIEELAMKDGRPEVESQISEIKLDYSKVGPKYGDKVGELEAALSNNEWMIEDGHLEVADEKLKPEEFDVIEEKQFTGEGEMIEHEGIMAVIK